VERRRGIGVHDCPVPAAVERPYLRESWRTNEDGSVVAYLQLVPADAGLARPLPSAATSMH